MTLHEAKEKVLATVRSEINPDRELSIVEDRIADHDFAWYIPFKNNHANSDDFSAGGYNGYFVDKQSGEMFRPGSAFSLDKWLLSFKMGLHKGRLDLTVQKINDRKRTIELLFEMNLQWHKEEYEGGTIWKTPQSFSIAMIEEKLAALPAVFLNQVLLFTMDTFKTVVDENIFSFTLEPTRNVGKTMGERIR